MVGGSVGSVKPVYAARIYIYISIWYAQIGGSLNIMAACQHFVILSVCRRIELVSPMSELRRLLNQIGYASRAGTGTGAGAERLGGVG